MCPKSHPLTFYVNKEQMLSVIDNPDSTVILDTRSVNEYTGLRQKKGANSSGRIFGSKLIDWTGCVNYNGDKKFKGYEELKEIYTAVIPDIERPVITYCHSSVRSTHTTFVLTELLGYKNVKNYDGSWTKWSQFEKHPKEKDSITTIIQ